MHSTRPSIGLSYSFRFSYKKSVSLSARLARVVVGCEGRAGGVDVMGAGDGCWRSLLAILLGRRCAHVGERSIALRMRPIIYGKSVGI